jgi:hypothetical protein
MDRCVRLASANATQARMGFQWIRGLFFEFGAGYSPCPHRWVAFAEARRTHRSILQESLLVPVEPRPMGGSLLPAFRQFEAKHGTATETLKQHRRPHGSYLRRAFAEARRTHRSILQESLLVPVEPRPMERCYEWEHGE